MSKGRIIQVFLVFLLLFSGLEQASAQRFGTVVNRSLFADKQAFGEGDIVTVFLMEYTQGTNETGTRTNSDSRLNTDAGSTGEMIGWGVPSFGIDGQMRLQNESSGNTTSRGSLQGKMTATVLEVQDNGLLIIQGERTVEVNGERQIMSLTGVVRPEDVTSDNTVMSYNIANAQIVYRGSGMVSSAGKPGIFTRLWNWLF